jgi:hypothetical protein
MKYYVYKHTFSNGIVYFGKGSGKRIFSNKRNKFWLNLYNKYGEPMREYLHKDISEELAYILEEAYIANSRISGSKSCNISTGGEASASGNIQSEITRAKISLKLKGVKKSDQTKQRMSEAWRKKVVDTNKLTFNRKCVLQFTKCGEFINEYRSGLLASQSTGINHSNISSVCNGKLKTAGGYHWKYKIKE